MARSGPRTSWRARSRALSARSSRRHRLRSQATSSASRRAVWSGVARPSSCACAASSTIQSGRWGRLAGLRLTSAVGSGAGASGAADVASAGAALSAASGAMDARRSSCWSAAGAAADCSSGGVSVVVTVLSPVVGWPVGAPELRGSGGRVDDLRRARRQPAGSRVGRGRASRPTTAVVERSALRSAASIRVPCPVRRLHLSQSARQFTTSR